ncbi:hypothetical protein LCGC14_1966450 [marine sediment metagenome]|uniref:Uncharacterized protein n=1 Tax=marine sediment metagenome TaxID=412755 RepID=A0A0F9FDF9_9ZZZZ|nr:hypothetical protein [Desulfobacterales bacterium]
MDKATELLIKLMRTMRCKHLDMGGKHHFFHGMYVCDVCDEPDYTPGISAPVIKEVKAYLETVRSRSKGSHEGN